jgi:hypothetical protein
MRWKNEMGGAYSTHERSTWDYKVFSEKCEKSHLENVGGSEALCDDYIQMGGFSVGGC